MVLVSNTAAARASFEERVVRRARSFGLKALVDLLVHKGYSREQILFEGNREGGATSLVSAVEFRKGPTPTVLVTVNLGLLGDNTLLPSYFFQEVERSPEVDNFYDFIRFFDHRLIDNYIRAVWPEDDSAVYGDYAFVQRALLRMSGFSSVSSLHWFVQSLFPELPVRVTRGAFADSTTNHACRTGESKLDGTGILGRYYEADAQGFLVELVAEEETDARGQAWATVLRERLRRRLLPVLAPFRIPIAIRLRVLTHASWARVEAPSAAARGYLGYDRIRGNASSGHSVVLWRGDAALPTAPIAPGAIERGAGVDAAAGTLAAPWRSELVGAGRAVAAHGRGRKAGTSRR